MKELIIENFMGQPLRIEDLGLINLFVGKSKLLNCFADELDKLELVKSWQALNKQEIDKRNWTSEQHNAGKADLTLDEFEKQVEYLNYLNTGQFEIHKVRAFEIDYNNMPLDKHDIEFYWNHYFRQEHQQFHYTQSIDVVRIFAKVAREQNKTDIRLFKLFEKDEELKVYKSDLEILEISAERNGDLR